uniref:Uncharacterized protein n=1 Tax=viral metagenome TaxID=1070528 RepID=A0A6C0L3S4_9ZZZZ|tara:strand:+ start:17342 stop:17449 length:108 start_codon:yes stop_codon:yes gene_type:complete
MLSFECRGLMSPTTLKPKYKYKGGNKEIDGLMGKN